MAKPVVKSAEAVALAETVRWVAAVWDGRTGFACRPRHGDRVIVVGHSDYATDPATASAVDAIIHALRTLGAAEAIGYRVLGLHEEAQATPAPVAALGQGSLF
jgi:hypothetical protein